MARVASTLGLAGARPEQECRSSSRRSPHRRACLSTGRAAGLLMGLRRNDLRAST
jgi:hypothetical protein